MAPRAGERRGRLGGLPAALVAALALLGFEGTAHAWCRTTTDSSAGGACSKSGAPLYWTTRCVGMSLQQGGSARFDLAAARAAADRALAEWSGHGCPADPTGCTGAIGAPPSIVASQLSPVACDQVQFNQKSGNAELIVFRDTAWPHDTAQIALTTVTFVQATGEIYDADIEVDTQHYKIAAADPLPAGSYDLQSILTHEVGHVLGLAHTGSSEATMYASYVAGETKKRDLAPDDVCGVCAAYPPNRAATCDSTPRNGLASECGSGETGAGSTSGCHCGVVGAASSAPDTLAPAALSLLALFTRRRRRR